MEIAKRHGLRIIEDCAQAHGAEYKGRKAGAIGDAGGFSFYYSKNLGGYGEGGFITTNDSALADKIRKVRDHGSGIRYHHDLVGFNGRLDEFKPWFCAPNCLILRNGICSDVNMRSDIMIY